MERKINTERQQFEGEVLHVFQIRISLGSGHVSVGKGEAVVCFAVFEGETSGFQPAVSATS